MMNTGRRRNTILNSFSGVAVKIINIALTFLSRTVFIKMLGVNYAGVSGVFTDVLTVLSFAELGVGSAIIYALYKPIATNDGETIKRLMCFYKKIYRIIALIMFSLGVLLLPFLRYIIKDMPDVKESIYIIYMLYVINTSSSYLLTYKASFLTAAQRDYVVSRIKIIFAILKMIVECIVLIITKNFILYLVINIVSTVALNYALSLKADKIYPILKEKDKSGLLKNEKIQLYKNIKALFLYKVSGVVLNGTDSIITSSFIGVGFVGIVGNYTLIINQLYNLIIQFFKGISASVGNLAATESGETQYSVFKKILFLCFWIYCFCVTCFWCLLNQFVNIWLGKEYLVSWGIIILLITEFYIKGMLSPISEFRTSNGLFQQGKYRPIIMAVINIFVSIFLVKRIGYPGIIIGTIFSRVVTQLWFDPYIIYKNVFKKSIITYYLTYIKYSAIAVVSCMLTRKICNVVTVSNEYYDFILDGLICLIIPNVILIILFYKTIEFKELVKLIGKIVKRGK